MTRIGWVTIWGGVLMVLVCTCFLYISFDYGMGSLVRMRAGYFPVVLASAGLIVGAILLVSGILRGNPDETFIAVPIRPFIFTLLAIGGFAILIRPWGLLPAVFASTTISSLGYRDNTLLDTVLITIGSMVFCVTVFVYLLGLPVPLIRGDL